MQQTGWNYFLNVSFHPAGGRIQFVNEKKRLVLSKEFQFSVIKEKKNKTLELKR